MSAASDYAAASAALNKTLPAYVSYTVNSHTKFDAMSSNTTHDVVVRTADATIVKGGGSPNNNVSYTGHSFNTSDNILKDPPFKASCYVPESAKPATYDGRPAEAIALRGTCKDSDDSESDFDTMYVDPRTHDPIAVSGADNKESVAVNIEQRFARTGAYVLPATLYVRVKGSGFMFWLDVLADLRFSNYGFNNKAP